MEMVELEKNPEQWWPEEAEAPDFWLNAVKQQLLGGGRLRARRTKCAGQSQY